MCILRLSGFAFSDHPIEVTAAAIEYTLSIVFDLQELIIVVGGVAAGVLLGWGIARWRVRGMLREQALRLERAVNEARMDALTGLWNRKALDDYLAIQMAIARRYG